ncbi:hypothetical protein [Saccharopolyspora hattusasensis]|uniref:hypothetical protein n=1 Tax=Saccharopolyspora hattusasensis TaxID=1128679 RepID=UPI003D972DCF
MRTVNSPSKIAQIMRSRDGAADPDQLVGVAAGELFEWHWLLAELADWLDHSDPATRADFDRFFGGFRAPEKVTLFLAMISERIGNLLDGDRGQP